MTLGNTTLALASILSMALPATARAADEQVPVLRDQVQNHGGCSTLPAPCPGPGCRAMDPGTGVVPYAKGRRIVYLNFDGVTLTSSQFADDARENISAIVNQSGSLSGFTPDALSNGGGGATRQDFIDATVEQMEETYAGLDVEFVTERPGAGFNYHMVVFVGSGHTCGNTTAGGDNCVGIALRDCNDSMANNIVFVFTWGQTWQDMIETASHEAGHAFGLDHIEVQGAIMYWTTGFSPTQFGAGEVREPQNSCAGTFQDSRAVLMDNIGPAGQDVLGPNINIVSHQTGDRVTGGSVITANVTDLDGTVDRVELELNGQTLDTATSAPHQMTVPFDTPPGEVSFRIRAYDTAGNSNFALLVLTMEGNVPCPNGNECGGGFSCEEGLCVPLATDGQLGSACGANEECLSQSCGTLGDESLCTQDCTTAADCPDGFECRGGSACWPKSGGGGCSAGGGQSGLAALWLLFAGCLVLFGRRRA